MRLFVVFALTVMSGLAWGSASPGRVLFVGNSYTAFNGPDSLEVSVQRLMEEHSGASEVVVAKHTVGGATLPMHLESARSGDLKALLEEGWDIVVLQDQSQVPGFPQSNADWQASREAAVGLAELAASAGAETRLFLTWGRETGDPQNADRYPDYSTMQDRLTEGYTAYAEAIRSAGLSVEIVEVGEVWRSIHDGIVESGGVPAEGDTLFTRLYLNDGSHPSPHGTYLAASTFFVALTGATPVGLNWAHEGISVEDKAAIQEAAAALLPPEPEDSDAKETAEPVEEEGEDRSTESGCGCDTSGHRTLPVGAVLLGALLLVRRRDAATTQLR